MIGPGYNDVYGPWTGITFPNNLVPTQGAPALTWDEFGQQVQGLTLRVKATGRNGPLGQPNVLSFEPGGYYSGWQFGQYNPWGATLDEFLAMCRAYDVSVLILPFENEEWRVDNSWYRHPWNASNGGPLADRTKVLSDPGAIDAAKRRLDAIVQVAGDVICGWEMAEFTQLFTAEFFGVPFSGLEQIVLEQGVPWMTTIAQHIHGIHDAPVGCGIVDKLDAARRFVNEMCRAPGLDFATLNWYGTQNVSRKMLDLRAAQAYTGLSCCVTQYAPWSIGDIDSYQRDDDPFPRSKEHEWAARCGGSLALRWPEASANSVETPWWGVAHPNLATIAGVTKDFGAIADMSKWAGAGEAWDDRFLGHLDYVSSWCDRTRLAAFLTWDGTGAPSVEIEDLPDGKYVAHWFDWVDGPLMEQNDIYSVGGLMSIFKPPVRNGRSVLYLAPQEAPPVPARVTLRLSGGGQQAEMEVEAGQSYTLDVLEVTP